TGGDCRNPAADHRRREGVKSRLGARAPVTHPQPLRRRGAVHDFTREKDERRQRELEALGVTVLRFWNYGVKNDMAAVVRRIEEWIRLEEKRRGLPRREASTKPTPNPSEGGERRSEGHRHGRDPSTTEGASSSSPLGRGQGWVSETP